MKACTIVVERTTERTRASTTTPAVANGMNVAVYSSRELAYSVCEAGHGCNVSHGCGHAAGRARHASLTQPSQ